MALERITLPAWSGPQRCRALDWSLRGIWPWSIWIDQFRSDALALSRAWQRRISWSPGRNTRAP